jgi:hypothetical protein
MEFTKPNSLNGSQLINELKAQGIAVDVIDDNGNGQISFDVAKNKEATASQIVAAHNGTETSPSIGDKLAQAGLTIDELKAALGV